jgi:hypothetical protein
VDLWKDRARGLENDIGGDKNMVKPTFRCSRGGGQQSTSNKAEDCWVGVNVLESPIWERGRK